LKTALFYGEKDIRVAELPLPEPGPGEALVRVRSAGVCGSDLHNYRGHRPPSLATPWQQGHELAGEVAALGDGVEQLKIGQRVAVEAEHLLGCGSCRWCAEAQNQLCVERGSRNGERQSSHGFSQYDVCVASNLHPISYAISFNDAALLDCYACGVHAANRSPVMPGDTAAIIGAGAIAMTLGQVLKARGAGHVVMIGTRPEPLDVAKMCGAADSAICIAEQDPVDAVRSLTAGEGAGVTFETVGGRSQLIAQAASMTRRGGAVSVLGLFTSPQQIDSAAAMQKELTVRWSNSFSSWEGRSEYAVALEMMEAGQLQAGPIVTHEFGIDRVNEAFAAADDKSTSNAIRVMVIP
jgi:2-desacetyl-2-hydroxyethyl bacteriochlorophyllide A dehydrogenase